MPGQGQIYQGYMYVDYLTNRTRADLTVAGMQISVLQDYNQVRLASRLAVRWNVHSVTLPSRLDGLLFVPSIISCTSSSCRERSCTLTSLMRIMSTANWNR